MQFVAGLGRKKISLSKIYGFSRPGTGSITDDYYIMPYIIHCEPKLTLVQKLTSL